MVTDLQQVTDLKQAYTQLDKAMEFHQQRNIKVQGRKK